MKSIPPSGFLLFVIDIFGALTFISCDSGGDGGDDDVCGQYSPDGNIHVPGDYGRLVDAIDCSNTGDTIIVDEQFPIIGVPVDDPVCDYLDIGTTGLTIKNGKTMEWNIDCDESSYLTKVVITAKDVNVSGLSGRSLGRDITLLLDFSNDSCR